MTRRIPIIVASSERFSDAEWLAPFSIMENTTWPVDIHVARPHDLGMQEHGCTGFTNLRYAVPQICRDLGLPGAIYLDVDMLVLGDVRELWNYYTPGKWVCMGDGSTEVSVICSSLNYPDMSVIHARHKGTFPRGDHVPTLPPVWNSEDCVLPGAKLVHYTNLNTQPWNGPHPDAAADRLYREYYARYLDRHRPEPDETRH